MDIIKEVNWSEGILVDQTKILAVNFSFFRFLLDDTSYLLFTIYLIFLSVLILVIIIIYFL